MVKSSARQAVESLGEGGYGVVKRCRRVKRPVLHDLAIKIIRKEKTFSRNPPPPPSSS